MNSGFVELTYDEWEDQFKPIVWNKDGYTSGLETYGHEYECVKFMLAFFPNHVWTESCHDFISSGWHFVDRMMYHITEVPFIANVAYEVSLDIHIDCEECGISADTACASCDLPLCGNCVIDVAGEPYCSGCEYDALKEVT